MNENAPISEPAPVPAPPSEPAPAPGQKWTGIIVGGIAAAVVIVAAVCALAGEQSQSPADASVAQTQNFLKNIEAGRVDKVYSQFPESFREDVRDLSADIAEKCGEGFFEEFAGVAKEASLFVDRNCELLLQMAKENMDEDVWKAGRFQESDLRLVARLLDGIAEKMTYARLSKGELAGILEIGALQEIAARGYSALKDNTKLQILDVKAEDKREKEMPVVLVKASYLDDGETTTDTAAIAFAKEGGTWFPIWATSADNLDDAREDYEKNDDEWLTKQWSAVRRRIRSGLKEIDSDDIKEATRDLSEVRTFLSKLNKKKFRNAEDLEKAIDELFEEQPNLIFAKNRNQSMCRACISNMRQIETAGENWLVEHNLDASGWKYPDSIVGEDNYIRVEPKCPAGGTYTVVLRKQNGEYCVSVTCSEAESKGHVLP